jgi:hypothetical protein
MADQIAINQTHPEIIYILREIAPMVQHTLRKRSAKLVEEKKRLDTEWVQKGINSAIGILVAWDVAIKEQLKKPSFDPSAIYNAIFSPRSSIIAQPPPRNPTSMKELPPPPPPSLVNTPTITDPASVLEKIETDRANKVTVVNTASIENKANILAKRIEEKRAEALKMKVFGKYAKSVSDLFPKDYVNEQLYPAQHGWTALAVAAEEMRGIDWAEDAMGHERELWEVPHAPDCPKANVDAPGTSKNGQMPELIPTDDQKPDGEGWPTPDPSDSEETASRSAIAAAMLPFYPRLTVDYRVMNDEPTVPSKKSRKKKRKHRE